MKIKVAAVQMPFGTDVPENVKAMEAAIRKLARKRVKLAVFPECCLSGYIVPAKDRDWPAIAAGLSRLRRLAGETRMCLVFGSALPNGRRLPFNSLLAVNERGLLMSVYDKAHLIGGDHQCFSRGRKAPDVVRLAGIKVAMQICFDSRFPELPRLAALSGAQVLVFAFAAFGRDGLWKTPVMEGHLRSRAAENGVFLVAANIGDRNSFVVSRIVNPDGLDLAAANPGRADAIVAEIDPAKAHRKFLPQRRRDLYRLT
ncbi:MAG TPA: carbon-nitrogen hydrolase family protein [Planctomycetota bacterium]|nr:carbon-nitrogen hydrolase family protein [Planctomycetota bacterium]